MSNAIDVDPEPASPTPLGVGVAAAAQGATGSTQQQKQEGQKEDAAYHSAAGEPPPDTSGGKLETTSPAHSAFRVQPTTAGALPSSVATKKPPPKSCDELGDSAFIKDAPPNPIAHEPPPKIRDKAEDSSDGLIGTAQAQPTAGGALPSRLWCVSVTSIEDVLSPQRPRMSSSSTDDFEQVANHRTTHPEAAIASADLPDAFAFAELPAFGQAEPENDASICPDSDADSDGKDGSVAKLSPLSIPAATTDTPARLQWAPPLPSLVQREDSRRAVFTLRSSLNAADIVPSDDFADRAASPLDTAFVDTEAQARWLPTAVDQAINET